VAKIFGIEIISRLSIQLLGRLLEWTSGIVAKVPKSRISNQSKNEIKCNIYSGFAAQHFRKYSGNQHSRFSYYGPLGGCPFYYSRIHKKEKRFEVMAKEISNSSRKSKNTG